ncbi:MAG: hypothetical protein Q4D57_05150 [Clostridia bacterium]|nr:hypothetical protein [Clostridia bacterium]
MTNNKTFKIEKLDDVSLENILGGSFSDFSSGICLMGAGITVIPGVVTSAASIACSIRSKRTQQKGNEKKSNAYKKTAKTLGIVSGGLLSVPVLLAGTGICFMT